MALSAGLAKGDTPPERLEVSATVTFQPGEGIIKGALKVRGTVPGLDAAGFQTAAEGAKANCPVSKALGHQIPDVADAEDAGSRRGQARSRPWGGMAHRRTRRRARALVHRDAGASVRPCGLQRPPRGGRCRPAPEGARGPVQARAGWRQANADLDARRAAIRARRDGRRLRGRRRAARGGAEALARRARPGRRQGRDRRDPPGRRRRRGRPLGRRPRAHARALRRAARLQVGGARGEPERRRRDQGRRLRDQGRRRLLDLQVRGRHPPRAARARRPSRRAGSTPRPRRSR